VGQGRLALKCIWFNGSYLEGKFHAGQTVALYGRVEPSRSSQNFKMIQPQFELLPDATDDAETRLLEVGRITPVYESAGWRAAGLALAAEGDLPPARRMRARWRSACP